MNNNKKEDFKTKLEEQINENDNAIFAYDDMSKFHVNESVVELIENLDESND